MEKQSHILVIMKIIRHRKMHNSEREGYDIAIVKADMSYPLLFADHVFTSRGKFCYSAIP